MEVCSGVREPDERQLMSESEARWRIGLEFVGRLLKVEMSFDYISCKLHARHSTPT